MFKQSFQDRTCILECLSDSNTSTPACALWISRCFVSLTVMSCRCSALRSDYSRLNFCGCSMMQDAQIGSALRVLAHLRNHSLASCIILHDTYFTTNFQLRFTSTSALSLRSHSHHQTCLTTVLFAFPKLFRKSPAALSQHTTSTCRASDHEGSREEWRTLSPSCPSMVRILEAHTTVT